MRPQDSVLSGEILDLHEQFLVHQSRHVCQETGHFIRCFHPACIFSSRGFKTRSEFLDHTGKSMPITPANPFKGRQYSGEVILLAVRWYLRYPLAYEHVAEMLAERGLEVDASCIWRWVQAYAPEINKRCRPHLRPTNKSYRIDETYIKVKGKDRYLYRAVDSTGQTIDFLLTAKRDTAAAKRFLLQSYRSIRQSDAAGHKRRQESRISGSNRSVDG